MSPASYKGLRAASERASRAARGASKKSNTKCEIVLRRALWARGLRYRIVRPDLTGKPDVIFMQAKVVVFCDGDFWHGRDLEKRLARLAEGHNPGYWLAKIQGNVARDRRLDEALRSDGWIVLRFWETDILKDAGSIADRIAGVVKERMGLPRTVQVGETGEKIAETPGRRSRGP